MTEGKAGSVGVPPQLALTVSTRVGLSRVGGQGGGIYRTAWLVVNKDSDLWFGTQALDPKMFANIPGLKDLTAGNQVLQEMSEVFHNKQR